MLFARQGAALIVNVAPFGCMPGTITSALCREIQTQTGVPIVSLFYDGEPGMNQRLEVFLAGLSAAIRPQERLARSLLTYAREPIYSREPKWVVVHNHPWLKGTQKWAS